MEPLKKAQVEGFLMFAEPELLFGNLDELCSVSVTSLVHMYVSFEFYVFTSMLYLIVAKCFHQIEDSQSHQSRSNESPFAMISIHWEG